MGLNTFAKKFTEEGVKRVIVRVISGYEHRLDEAVENDYRLLERTDKYRPQLMEKFDTLIMKQRSIIEEITHEEIFDLLKKKKPELYQKIMNDEEKREWAKREVKAILNYAEKR